MAAVLTGLAASGPLILKAIELIEAFSTAYETLRRVESIVSTITPLAIQCDEHFRALLGVSHISAQDLYTAVSKFVTDVAPVIESEGYELSKKVEETRQAADKLCSLAKKDNLSIQKGLDNVKNTLQTICEELCHTQSSIVEDAERPLKELGDRITELTKAIGPSPISLTLIQRFYLSVKAYLPSNRPRVAKFAHDHDLVATSKTDSTTLDTDAPATAASEDESTACMGPIPELIVREPNYRDFVITMINEFNSILGFFKTDPSSTPHAIRSAALADNKEREEHVEKLTKLKNEVDHKAREIGIEKHEIEELIKVFSSLSGKVCQFSKLWAKIYGDLMSLSKYLDDPQNYPTNDEELLTHVKAEQKKYENTMVTLKSYETHVVVEPKN